MLEQGFLLKGNRRTPLPASGHGLVLTILGVLMETHSHAGKTTVGERLRPLNTPCLGKQTQLCFQKSILFADPQTSHFQTTLWFPLCSPTPLIRMSMTSMVTSSTWTWSHCCTADRKNIAYDDRWHLIPPAPLFIDAGPFASYELRGTARFVLQAPRQQLGDLLYNSKFFSRE